MGAVAPRVIIVWLYDNAGKSVFAAAVLDATSNLSWQLFPVIGSFFDPRISGVIMAVTAIVVVVIWRPRTLAGYRNGSASAIRARSTARISE